MNKEAKPNMLDIFELASDDFPQSDSSNPKQGTLNSHRVKSKVQKLPLHRLASDRNMIASRDSPKQILRSVLSKVLNLNQSITP